MRRIPIGLLIDEALTHPPKELIELAGLPQFNSLAALRDAGLSLLRQQKPKTSSGRGRPVKYGPEHYAEVARIHSENPGRPTQAVAEAFEVNRTTASNWVRKARELGLTVDLRAAPIRGE